MAPPTPYVRWFEELRAEDVAQVGGKNASLGEMIRALKHEGVRVPDGHPHQAKPTQEASMAL